MSLNSFVTHPRRFVRPFLAVARRVATCSFAIAVLAGMAASSLSPESSSAATSANRALFVAVSNSYSAAVTEFNLVIDSFSACTSSSGVATAIDGRGDTRFYQMTLALEKRGPYPSGIAKDVNAFIANLIAVQKEMDAVARAPSVARQRSIVAGTLELEVDNLAFRGMHLLIYLGEQTTF